MIKRDYRKGDVLWEDRRRGLRKNDFPETEYADKRGEKIMAIEYSLLLKSQNLTKEILIRKIESLGYFCDRTEILTKGIYINLNKKIGFSIFLLGLNEYPYNCWETNFIEREFVFEKILKFRMAKEYSELELRYNVMLNIIFDIAMELNEEAIFIGNGDTELCFFRESGDIFINNETGIWDKDCFRDVIKDKRICHV